MVPLAFRVVLDSMAISVFVVILGDFTNTESETSRLVKGGFTGCIVVAGVHISHGGQCHGGFNDQIGPDNWGVLMITVSTMRKC